MADDSAISEPECLQFLAFWKSLIKGENLPHTSDFLTSPDPELIRFVQILEITDLGQLFRFMGTGLVDLWGFDQTNSLFGEELPKDLKEFLDDRNRLMVAHPCGLIDVAEYSSPTGRPFEMETIVLPLAVDDGRPPRYCSFSKVMEPMEREDSVKARYRATQSQSWFDIGFGIPDRAPL